MTTTSSKKTRFQAKADEYIECTGEDRHKNYVLHNVVCSECTKPMFQVRWFYIVALGLTILVIGFILGALQDDWVFLYITPALLVSGLSVVYLLVLARRIHTAVIKCIALFLLSFPITLLAYYRVSDALNYPAVQIVWTISLYVACVVAFLYCFIEWRHAVEGSGITGLIKGFPALSTAFFFTLLLISWINNRLQFLDLRVLGIIRHHIFLREALFVISITLIAIYALVETINKKVDAKKNYFETTTHIGLLIWSESVKGNNILSFAKSIIRPVWNATLNIYKGITESFKSTVNYVIYLIVLGAKWFANYVLEFIKLIWSTIQVVLRTLLSLIRRFILPLVIFCLILYINFGFIGILYRHIHATATSTDYTWAILFFLELQIGISIFIWLVSERHRFSDTLKSVLATNLVLTLVMVILAWLATLILWLIASVMFPETPLTSVGSFTYLFITAAVLFIVGLQARTMMKSRT